VFTASDRVRFDVVALLVMPIAITAAQLRLTREDFFTTQVRPQMPLMYRMAYRWTRDRDEAEDLVQDVLARLVPKANPYQACPTYIHWYLVDSLPV
jgi:hypothetical protein